MGKNKISPAYRVASAGILCAEAAALAFLESLLPPLPFMPPGAKPGLSNIIVMFSVASAGLPAALAVVLSKALLALLTRGISAFAMSLCGGVLSALVMFAMTRIKPEKTKLGYVGVSVLSAVAHNAGQLAAASVISGSALWAYLPPLILFGVVFGAVTGAVLGAVMPVLNRQSLIFIKSKQKRMQGDKNEAETAGRRP